jgi:succinylarginine dihydrolase
MGVVLNRLFRPEYGDKWVVTPRRWWSRKDRRAAKVAAKVCEYQASQPEFQEAYARAIRASIFYDDVLSVKFRDN